MSAPAKTVVSFSTPHKKRIDRLAKRSGYTRSQVINQALESLIELEEWQLQKIDRGLADASAKHFASTAQVQALFGKAL